jgi:hypothetical protein
MIEKLPTRFEDWTTVLGTRANYARGATPQTIVIDKVNEIIAETNRLSMIAATHVMVVTSDPGTPAQDALPGRVEFCEEPETPR